MYYKCVKFHKNPIGRLGGVALTRYMDGRCDSYIPPQTLFAGGIMNLNKQINNTSTVILYKLLNFVPDLRANISSLSSDFHACHVPKLINYCVSCQHD